MDHNELYFQKTEIVINSIHEISDKSNTKTKHKIEKKRFKNN